MCRTSQTVVAHNYKLLEFKLNTRYHLHATPKSFVTDLYKSLIKCQAYGDILRELCLTRDGIFFTELNLGNIINLIDNICLD